MARSNLLCTHLCIVGHVKGIDRLKYNVAASAFHDSSERLDPPKCHPDTRRALLDEILNWILEDVARETWLMWLHGAAGAGKSAIGQSIAELCIVKGIIVTNFFFHRADLTRNSLASVVATLAYQLAVLIPEMQTLVVQVIEANPLIFKQSFSTQFEQLIVRPLRQQLPESTPRWKMLFLLDGLDECDRPEDQTQIVHVIGNFLKERNLPIVVLFSSRPESHLRSAFNSPYIATNLLKMPLDNHYLPDPDIRLFLDDVFRQIKSKHPLAHLLASDWPSPAAVQEIVDKSSGQFIYASAVLKFISSPRQHPAQQLDMILGLRPSGRSTPFAQLDALYHHIFSKIQDLAHTIQLLAYAILGATSDINRMATFFDVFKDDIYSAMDDLSSVISCQDDELRFLHFSLPDFLLDRARSGQYYINPAEQCIKLSILGLQRLSSKKEIGTPAQFLPTLRLFSLITPDRRRGIFEHPKYRRGQPAAARKRAWL